MKDNFDLTSPLLENILDRPIRIKEELSQIVTDDYTITQINPTLENYSSQTREIINPILNEAENKGYKPNISTAIFEAVKNAFEHGNSRSPNKSILIGHKFNDKSLELLVCDKGKELHKSFLRFILAQRNKKSETNFLKWYEFSKTKPRENTDNLGLGTSFIHAYMDKIGYFYNSESDGLALYMRKNL